VKFGIFVSVDIDECRDPHLNKCGKRKCVNVLGSYRCEKTWPAILSKLYNVSA
jgi:hypothetical protein